MSTEQLSTVTIEKKITVNRQFYHTIETLLTARITYSLCSSKTYPTPPPRPPGGNFCFSSTTPLGFSIPRVLVISPTPWNFRNFPFWLGSPRKEYFRQKCRCTILLCEGQSAIKREKIFSFMLTQCQIISILPFGDLS